MDIATTHGWFYRLLTLTGFLHSTSSTFVALLPREFHPGWPLRASVAIHGPVSSPVNVVTTLQAVYRLDMKDVMVNRKTFYSGDVKLLEFQVPADLDPSPTYRVKFDCSGGLEYTQNERLEFNPNTSVVLVQTDKTIYKPGQLVRIRVLNVDKQLQPTFRPLTVTIINGLGNKVERFYNISGRTGVVEETFQLSKYPVMGEWKIHVTDDYEMSYFSSFKVEEFVLPKFSVEVTANPVHVVNSKVGTTIAVTSVYTFGKGVQGNCKVILRSQTGKLLKIYYKDLSPQGEVEFRDIDWNDIVRKMATLPDRITVTAEVTDETGRTESGEAQVELHDFDVQLKIMDKTTTVVREQIKAYVYVHVSDLQGNPILGSEVEVSISLQGKAVVLKKVLEAGQTEVSFTYLPESVSQSSYNNAGTIVVTLTSFRDISASKKIWMYQSKMRNGITVAQISQSLAVGGTTDFKVEKHKPNKGTDTTAYMVVSQGTIVSTGQISESAGSEFRVAVTQEMCPSAQVAVYMVVGQAEPEIVLDSMSVSPTGCFSKEVKVSFDTSEARVSTDVNMKLGVSWTNSSNAMPGSHSVYYLAVDKSIVLLEGGSHLNKHKVNTALDSLKLESQLTDWEETPWTANMFFKIQ